MPKFEFEFNQTDKNLVVSQDAVELGQTDYIRLTIYPTEAINNIVDLPDSSKGIDGKAIFFSTLASQLTINISPFTDNEQFRVRDIGDLFPSKNDFQIFENPNGDIYIKPNEIFNDFQLPQGDYRIQIDFLNQVKPSAEDGSVEDDSGGGYELFGSTDSFPFYDIQTEITWNYEDFKPTIDNIPKGPSVSEGYENLHVIDFISSLDDSEIIEFEQNPYNEDSNALGGGLTLKSGQRYTLLRNNDAFIGTENPPIYWNPELYFSTADVVQYKFIIKQISTSRKEVRLKILDETIINNSIIISHLTNEFNNSEPEFLNDTDLQGNPLPNPNYKYQFKHVLNIGTGYHTPIMNYTFDAVTDGKNNQSIILKLYDSLPTNVGNLSMVTIEREVLTTQTQDIFYFSDVPDVFFGDGLDSDAQENWINPDGNDVEFENLDDLTHSASISLIESNRIISQSEYGYPNLNTNFNEFENHIHFGSAKKKLENFKTKVETIQGYYSDISSSLSISSSIDNDSPYIIQTRQTFFNKINEEINKFTPYERFLYFDGQQESTASAPGIGKNYADTQPLTADFGQIGSADNYEELYQKDGFNVVYKNSNDGNTSGVILIHDKYKVQDKPFFNYSGSVYLSFLMKASKGLDLRLRNTNNLEHEGTSGFLLPHDTYHKSSILEPTITGSEYRRFIYEASQSYFVPNTNENDMADITLDGDFDAGSTKIQILSGSVKTGSSQIKDSTGLYPTTVVTQSGVPFFGSIKPAGELFNLFYTSGSALTQSFITDVKVTLKNPSNVLPFDNVFKTTSTEWTDWYNDMLTKAENFDTDNIHSFENNLPLYIQESSEYNDMKDFLNLQGEQYDIIKNHIDSMGTIHERGYKKTNSPPDNTLPMLLNNMGWEAINPFSGSLSDSLGSYLTGVTSIDDIKNNTWRKTLNNLLYIYKSKGTKNSIRGLLNVYGYPPDVLEFQEFGGPVNTIISSPLDSKLTGTGAFDLNTSTGSYSYNTKIQKLYNYKIKKNLKHVLNTEHYRNNAPVNTIEFVYKHANSINEQKLLEKASNAMLDQTMFDLTLKPSSNGLSSSLEFRINNSQTGSLAIVNNALSMSTSYLHFNDGELWNIMLQRMTSSNTGDSINEYRLHTALQDGSSIKTYAYVTMSISGSGITNDTNTFANENWFQTGSFNKVASFGNLSFGGRSVPNTDLNPEITGSLAEIRGWSTALSKSRFQQHILNKFSTVGNTINSYKDELVYHFKLNENYISESVSQSAQNLTIVDSAPKTTYSDFSFTKSGDIFTGSVLYGFDIIDISILQVEDNSQFSNDNQIIISPNRRSVGNLNPHKPAVESLTNSNGRKPQVNVSPRLELYRSPQTYVNNYIVDKISGFNLETLYGNPINYYSQSYTEIDTFRKNFFDAYPIQVDTNKFIRAHENMFNHSIEEGIKKLVPARSTFSDRNSNMGVEIKPTILEKQKYENEKHSVEVNPNKAIGNHSINIDLSETIYNSIKKGEAVVKPTTVGSYEVPYTDTISLGNAYVTSSGYLKDAPAKNHFQVPFLQPGGLVTTIVNPYSASFTYSETRGIKNIPPTLNNSSVPTSKDGTIDYGTDANQSYVSVHKNWGRTNTDVHHINFAAPTGSDGTFNTYHIEKRVVFHTIGDCEYYSGSVGYSSDFTNINNFYNHLQLTDGPDKAVSYIHLRAEAVVSNFAHNYGKNNFAVGRRMGKTRFMREYLDENNNKQLALPRNHVTKFNNPWTDRMYKGSQNTDPGFLNVNHEDYATSSFYRVKVTPGENQIYVKGKNNPIKGGDDKIIY